MTVAHAALAADEQEAVITVSAWPFYIVALLIAGWVAVLLNKMARANKQVGVTTGYQQYGGRAYDKDLAGAIDRELAGYVGSAESRTRLVSTLTSAVSERLEEKVAEATTGLKTQYESIVAEKDREREIAHLKYKNVLAEKNQTEAIVQSLAEGVVVVNGRGEVMMMNAAAEKLLGVEKGKKVGRPLKENLKGDELVSLVGEAGKGSEKLIELDSTQLETRKVIRASSAVVENENGQTIGMVSVLTDITKQKELDQLKSQFVSTVTHELRTPVVAMQKALTVVLDKTAGPLTEDQLKFLDIANRNLNRLGFLITDLLDFSKLEAGKMNMEFTDASVARVITETCDALSTWIHSKQIVLERGIADNLPDVRMDPQRITQVLSNLLSNALKFTPPSGRVSVGAKLAEGGRMVEVSVDDTGPGISKKDLEKVFERFLQLGERRSSDVSGTGLGLSIAREIVELHGGKIWAQSQEGKGATFIFTLPVKKSG